MKKILLVIMIVSGFLFAQNEAYDALKVLEPYIGKWKIKESTYGFFEGLPENTETINSCLLYTSPSPRDRQKSRMPSSA